MALGDDATRADGESNIDDRWSGLDATPDAGLGAVPAGPSDAELIAAVRGGDTAAFGLLYQRHSGAAYGLARQLANSPSGADDLVAEAFAKVLEALRQGRGPDSAFRAYLLTTLRHSLYDNTRRDRRLQFSDDLTSVDPGTPFVDTAVAELESSMVARAYATLPERWQAVLWHTEIEGQKPADVAPLLGLTPNAAAALAYRAREGLRQAYLQAHLAESAQDSCRYTVERLGAWSRGGLSKRETTQVEAHLQTCDRCSALAAELEDVNSGLRAVIAPMVLGAPFVTGYLASIHAGAGVAAVTVAAGSAAATGAAVGTAIGTGAGAGGAAGAAVGGASSHVGRIALGAAAAAAAVVVAAGAAFALTRNSGPSANDAGTAASAGVSSVAPVVPLPAASSSAASLAPSNPVATPAPTDTTPPPAATPSASAPPVAASSAPPATRAPAAPVTPVTSAPQAPALHPISVSVGVSFAGTGGDSGTLSGAVSNTPQIRLLDGVPAGWTVSISGPCAEGSGATTVCTLSGASSSASVQVSFTPTTQVSSAIRIGLFAAAGDASSIDTF